MLLACIPLGALLPSPWGSALGKTSGIFWKLNEHVLCLRGWNRKWWGRGGGFPDFSQVLLFPPFSSNNQSPPHTLPSLPLPSRAQAVPRGCSLLPSPSKPCGEESSQSLFGPLASAGTVAMPKSLFSLLIQKHLLQRCPGHFLSSAASQLCLCHLCDSKAARPPHRGTSPWLGLPPTPKAAGIHSALDLTPKPTPALGH